MDIRHSHLPYTGGGRKQKLQMLSTDSAHQLAEAARNKDFALMKHLIESDNLIALLEVNDLINVLLMLDSDQFARLSQAIKNKLDTLSVFYTLSISQKKRFVKEGRKGRSVRDLP